MNTITGGPGGTTYEIMVNRLIDKVAELEKKVIYLELGLAQIRQERSKGIYPHIQSDP